MVDNQHKKIKGYRDLSEQEIALMNEGKELAEKCGEFLDKLKQAHTGETPLDLDQRWLSVGQTHLQQGFMAVIRSIAQPTTF